MGVLQKRGEIGKTADLEKLATAFFQLKFRPTLSKGFWLLRVLPWGLMTLRSHWWPYSKKFDRVLRHSELSSPEHLNRKAHASGVVVHTGVAQIGPHQRVVAAFIDQRWSVEESS